MLTGVVVGGAGHIRSTGDLELRGSRQTQVTPPADRLPRRLRSELSNSVIHASLARDRISNEQVCNQSRYVCLNHETKRHCDAHQQLPETVLERWRVRGAHHVWLDSARHSIRGDKNEIHFMLSLLYLSPSEVARLPNYTLLWTLKTNWS